MLLADGRLHLSTSSSDVRCMHHVLPEEHFLCSVGERQTMEIEDIWLFVFGRGPRHQSP